MLKQRSVNKIIMVLAILLLFLAGIYQHFANQQDVLGTLQQGESNTVRFESIEGDYPSYKLWDIQDEFLGYGVIADASGYGGKLTMLSIVDELGTIKSVALIEDYETPLYLNKVVQAGLFEELKGRNLQDTFTDLDGVTGATVTVDAIFAAVQKGTIQIGNGQLGMKLPYNTTLNVIWQDVVAVVLLVAAVVSSFFNMKRLRPWLLVLAVIFIGFIMNYSLTYSNFVSILTGNLPVFIERPIWYVMVLGILLITLILGRNVYCNWFCPFGAAQEGIYKSLNLYSFSPSGELRRKVSRARWPMLWLVAIIALVFNNPGIASYEPFAVFFDGSGNRAQWIIMLIVLLLSMAQLRFWCHNFCPVGAILNFTARIKGKFKKLKQDNQAEDYPVNIDCEVCAGKSKEMNRQDKFYIIVVAVVNILVIVSLLESIGLIG
ncbi:MAG: 4Fe-4S binding protein [Desulfitobacterium sp.]